MDSVAADLAGCRALFHLRRGSTSEWQATGTRRIRLPPADDNHVDNRRLSSSSVARRVGAGATDALAGAKRLRKPLFMLPARRFHIGPVLANGDAMQIQSMLRSPLKTFVLLAAGAAAGITFLISCNGGPGSSSADGGGGGAGVSTGSCGTCSVPATLHTLTADTDLAQLSGGAIACKNSDPLGAPIADGPFVLTDLAIPEFGAVRIFTVPKGESCDQYGTTFAVVGSGIASSNQPLANRPSLYGARMLVSADETLCSTLSCSMGASSLRWSGFKPYGL